MTFNQSNHTEYSIGTVTTKHLIPNRLSKKSVSLGTFLLDTSCSNSGNVFITWSGACEQ